MELLEMPGVVFHKLSKGQVWLQQGEMAEHVYYLTKGAFRRSFITDKGDEVIYGAKHAGDFAESLIGVLPLYSNGISSTDFVAMMDCEGYLIPKNIFLAYARSQPALLEELLRMSMVEHRRLMLTFQSHQEQRVANRLCQILLDHAKPGTGGALYIHNLSNIEMAALLGIHKVTVAKIIKHLKEEGVLAREGSGLKILQVSRLEDYAAGEKMEYH